MGGLGGEAESWSGYVWSSCFWRYAGVPWEDMAVQRGRTPFAAHQRWNGSQAGQSLLSAAIPMFGLTSANIVESNL